ncbi:NADPH-dependent F420 reductase [Streptomyces sp. NPDC058256]|uniref:NADPH-dependent F420 reductase n=1 Tax=Streptomyces sp. NPDC058256 TaxID=3346408 RepID=UPI0036E6AD26
MTTAVIGAGNVGARLARGLASGGERIVIATRNQAQGQALAEELGPLASSASVADAIAEADTVIFAVWLDTIQEMVKQYADVLPGKIVVDASNPLAADGKGGFRRTLPENESSGQLVAGLVPQGAYLVKAFGTLGAESLSADAHREPERAVLFYATDDTPPSRRSSLSSQRSASRRSKRAASRSPGGSRSAATCTSSAGSTGRSSASPRRRKPWPPRAERAARAVCGGAHAAARTRCAWTTRAAVSGTRRSRAAGRLPDRLGTVAQDVSRPSGW